MDEIEHRITKLESETSNMQAIHFEQKQILVEIRNELGDIKGELTKVKGFSTGVAATFGLVGAFFTFIWDELVRH